MKSHKALKFIVERPITVAVAWVGGRGDSASSTGTRLRMGMEPGSNFSFKVSIAAALRAMLTIFVGQPSIDEGEAGRPPARNGPWPPKHRRVRNETAQGNALGQCKPMDMSTESAAPSAFGHI